MEIYAYSVCIKRGTRNRRMGWNQQEEAERNVEREWNITVRKEWSCDGVVQRASIRKEWKNS